MKFSEYLQEDAAVGSTGAGSIAGARGLLFSNMMTRAMPTVPVKKIKFNKLSNWSGYKRIQESDDGKFNAIDVISKLHNAERYNELEKDAVVYGIEGDDGAVTKVYVSKDQDQEFQHALNHELKDADNKKDVAEILFNLRNSFDILHVEWPAVPEDEEVNVEMDKDKSLGDEGVEKGKDEKGDMGDIGDMSLNGEEDLGDTSKLPSDIDSPANSDDQSILFKVIDMLKADAEAKAAEAHAKAKEAEAKEAGFAAQITNHKVKAEEEMATADSYFSKQKEERKAADRLSKLAKYRQEVSQGIGESAKSKRVYEDVQQDVALLQSQLANLNVRKARATKTIDDQIRRIQQQLAIKSKQLNANPTQLAGSPQANAAQPINQANPVV